jgi:hypothetical protein
MYINCISKRIYFALLDFQFPQEALRISKDRYDREGILYIQLPPLLNTLVSPCSFRCRGSCTFHKPPGIGKWLIGPADYILKRRMSFPITNLSEYQESFVSKFAEATRL